MERYDPSETPDPHEWLAKSEFERIALVEEFHRRHPEGVPAGREMVHAATHVIVENQIAMGVESVGETVARLVDEGLDRHEAIHAIGALVAGDMLGLARGDEQSWDQDRYRKRLKKLTAKRWKKGKW